MGQDWQEVTRLTRGQKLLIERVRLEDSGIAIEGQFELPPLARLDLEDQVFVAAFVRSHGSIKEMEALFGVSYPTVKNRLNRIAGQLEFVTVDLTPDSEGVLDRLEQGEISVQEALEQLEQREH